MRLILKLILFSCWTLQIIRCDEIIVKVQQGKLSGKLLPAVIDNKQYYSFKGIPYAKPPIGKLRFKAPEDPEPWDGIRNATAHGNVCPQFNPLTQKYTSGSEDCLFLNVYTPTLSPKRLLPVLFYIHGGAYIFESGNSAQYGPDYFVTKDVLVVTINYRLSTLGFLSLETEEVSGNAGLKDQLAALKWVNKNIKSFRGDPKKVTIIGGTAGGSSVTYHMISKKSKGLFQRAISWSGTPSCDWSLSYKPRERAMKLAYNLGFDSKNTTEVLNFLQSVPHDVLINTKPTVLASEEINQVLFKMQPFAPVIEIPGENSFITEDAFVLLDKGSVNKVDAMFAYNNQESLLLVNLFNSSYVNLYRNFSELFVPSKILVNFNPDQILALAEKVIKYYFGNKKITTDNMPEFVKYASNGNIAYHINRFARRWPSPKKTYFLKMSYYSSRNVYGQQGEPYGVTGSAHFDERFYQFNPEELNLTLTEGSLEYTMVQNTTNAIVNFAKYGNPNNRGSLGVEWPQFNAEDRAYVNFRNDGLTLEYGPDDEDTEFWKSIYEYVGLKF